jgi:hypothetical protein
MADSNADHIFNAEALSAQAKRAADEGNFERASALAAIAQVHATLATLREEPGDG